MLIFDIIKYPLFSLGNNYFLSKPSDVKRIDNEKQYNVYFNVIDIMCVV